MAVTEGLGPYSQDCLDLLETLEIDAVSIEKLKLAQRGLFTPIGSVRLMGEPIAAGIKKREIFGAGTRVARELHFLDQLLTKSPASRESVPFFTYAVGRDDGQRYYGILTEDFTQGGTRGLHEVRNGFSAAGRDARLTAPEGLHREVYDAFGGNVYTEAFRHMIGYAFDKEVLIDYDDVAYPSGKEIAEYEKLVEAMTIRVD